MSGPKFDIINDAAFTDMAGRWFESGNWNSISGSVGRWHGIQDWSDSLRPTLLRGLRVDRFQATFAFYRANAAPSAAMKFMFNATDPDSYDYIRLSHSAPGAAPYGDTHRDGTKSIFIGGTGTAANVPAVGGTDPLWVRITHNGITLTVRCAASEAGLASASDCYRSTGYGARGGIIGLAPAGYYPEVDDLKVYADRDHDGSY